MHSAPIINPTLPALIEEGLAIPDTNGFNPQCAFIGDCLLEKKMHKYSNQVLISGVSESAAIIWNIREKLNLQATLGTGQYTWKLPCHSEKISGGILWSFVTKLIFFNVRDFNFAIDAQAGGWDTHNSLLRYWQVSPAFTYRLGPLSPYAGCAINRTRGKFSAEKTLWFHESQHLGPFVGVSYSRGNWFLANFEWRGVFEEGLSAVAQVRF